ncbi:MAG TPA: sigma-70 family RNA polymerase sigma factor [Clostridiales bacterium]|nr:sigma-70 family RNA polymerase sigma factor [Clostridiales bacterium]
MLKQREVRLTKDEEVALGYKIKAMQELKSKIESKSTILTAQERQIMTEGEKAVETIVSNYYNLARNIAHKHHKKTGTRYSIEDLLQDAISALVEAAFNYDPDKNCYLGTYAYYGITKRVSTTINFQRLVRMPENKMGEYILISNAQKIYNELTEAEKDEYDNELEFIYENVDDLKKEEVDLILTNMQPQVSLNSPIFDGDGELMDILVDENSVSEIDNIDNLDIKITNVIDKLSQYEKDLIAFEYGLYPASMDYSEFKKKYDLTDRKVKAEIKKAERKMKKIAEKVA